MRQQGEPWLRGPRFHDGRRAGVRPTRWSATVGGRAVITTVRNIGLPVMNVLSANEAELIGSWVIKSGRVIKDDVTKRIEWLMSHSLRRLANDSSGWDTLFQDPSDRRLWELIYPQSGMHGGGPPLLRVVTPATARDKYRWP